MYGPKKHLLRCKNIVCIIGFISHVSGEEESDVLLDVHAHLMSFPKMIVSVAPIEKYLRQNKDNLIEVVRKH